MKVFKFGGASVKDAAGVRNVANVLAHFPEDDLLIVVSAMGKTTNALELVNAAWQDGEATKPLVDRLRREHLAVLMEVAPHDAAASAELVLHFDRLNALVEQPAPANGDQGYDQVVAFGELWSTLIVSAHLNAAGFANKWVDARKIITTDGRHRMANVKWDALEDNCATHLPSFGQQPHRIVTQGFIGQTEEGNTTTLGREGSDFSAAIFAYALDAESVTIWKDVPGMFNADPNKFADTRLLEHISYKEAIELSYFGASVIHPRTLQPLQRKGIPLYVRSFMDLGAKGSTISGATDHDTLVPSFIVKPEQLLISITPRDLSFVVEENLSGIFKLFAARNVRIELMQNSAVAFTVAVDDTPRAHQLIEDLHREYEVRYNEGCELITVRHFDEATLQQLLQGKEPLIEQRSRVTARYVVK
ncbi:MAG: aspartate kinase [Flavobacteriales bacterium]|nr:aspartate kinase [Flavobacteriales bacterium]MBP9079460.1 aspartate kinase [Flavobacteriales bacterium]